MDNPDSRTFILYCLRAGTIFFIDSIYAPPVDYIERPSRGGALVLRFVERQVLPLFGCR